MQSVLNKVDELFINQSCCYKDRNEIANSVFKLMYLYIKLRMRKLSCHSFTSIRNLMLQTFLFLKNILWFVLVKILKQQQQKTYSTYILFPLWVGWSLTFLREFDPSEKGLVWATLNSIHFLNFLFLTITLIWCIYFQKAKISMKT